MRCKMSKQYVTNYITNNPDLHSATFRRGLKTFLFQQCLVH